MRSTVVVSGTTCTRFRCLFDRSLLTITAGRSLRTSPPTAGSKFTHHTSPRFIGNVSYRALTPFQRFGFANLVTRHLSVGSLQVLGDHVRAHQFLDELANFPPADDR